ncbi:MAG: hypothetical protein J6S98_06210 [Lentisphaeria bacterium]|nr:hypothetical protein [Lentisphaerota bacterium]MBO5694979.1 hypothetical protein [Lentisphaeria bacterium]
MEGRRMTIPLPIVWEIVLVVVGFILGTLWGHHNAIGKRITYSECSEKRKSCPCIGDIEGIKKQLERIDL